jgi:undecaprenyl-diphosphatase
VAALTIYQAIFLGIVQGLTEFLPISSSGHLLLLPWLFAWPILHDAALNKTFDVGLHFGTLVALFSYYARDAIALLVAWLRSIWRRRILEPTERLAWMILITVVPAGLFGWRYEEFIEQRLGDPRLISLLLIAFALLLALAELTGRKRRAAEEVGLKDAIIIGCAQALSLFPGVSRSGVTITTGLFLGLKRDAAARFTFLMSLPIIAGTALYKGMYLARAGLPQGLPLPFAAGVIASALSGYAAVAFLIRYLQTRTVYPFVWYRVALGLGVLALWVARAH